MYLVVERRGEERRESLDQSLRGSEQRQAGRRAGGVTWELRESDKDN
jgi:hypothetical protein